MKDRIKESMSALCDGECNELELRRVLNYVGSDAEMREEWRRYQLIGALMRDEPAGAVDLSGRIMKALDDEREFVDVIEEDQTDAFAGSVEQPVARKAAGGMPQWLVSGAVAASVTLAVLAGARIVNEQSLSEQAMFAAQQPVKAEVAAPAPVSQPAMVASTAKSVPAVSAEELSQAQQVLQQYVLEHEEQAAGVAESDPFARVANFGQNGNQAKPR